ncbi:ParB N-terminal domain-containing protein [Candidatus Parcubacteria bacterium]|nr:ParB N-terminal domain-containing protein [Candidatus Parcubacteria bacterium]
MARKKEKNKEKEFQFQDPYKNYPLTLKIVDIEDLAVISHQRKPSDYHVRHLTFSIERVGFLVPLIVIEEGKKYLILDGQHRFLAAKKLGIQKLPVIVVPQALADLMMNLNIEKELNIREKAYVALNIYYEYLAKDPKLLETDPILTDAIENAYYVTLGLGYKKQEKLRGGTIETILKKCDFFVEEPLNEALKEREKRAEIVLTVDNLMKEIAQTLKEMDKWHPFVYQQIISFANPYKRKRGPFDFYELMKEILNNLQKAKEDPEIILKEKLEEQ